MLKHTIQYVLTCTIAVVMAGSAIYTSRDQYANDEHVCNIEAHGSRPKSDVDDD